MDGEDIIIIGALAAGAFLLYKDLSGSGGGTAGASPATTPPTQVPSNYAAVVGSVNTQPTPGAYTAKQALANWGINSPQGITILAPGQQAPAGSQVYTYKSVTYVPLGDLSPSQLAALPGQAISGLGSWIHSWWPF